MTEPEQSSPSSPEQQKEPQTTENQKRQMLHLLARAMKDEVWRQALLTDPKPLIEHELGITFPPGVTIQVHETTSTTIHLVLPPRQLPPVEVSDADLTTPIAAITFNRTCLCTATGGGDNCLTCDTPETGKGRGDCPGSTCAQHCTGRPDCDPRAL
jgi:hypothetical protein